ncbi:MAG: glycerol-3-phosphate dehydrogenase [Alphaproteobacteria bacterium]
MATNQRYDIFIIGGGINGCGIARDAAGRGFKVGLAEMNDLASATSSASTKLIHGGLRYLEYYEFRLVHEALSERELLWEMAPHIIHPLRFILPHQKGMRPAWMLRLGLFLYDHIGGRKRLAATDVLDLRQDAASEPLKTGFSKAFEYSDCLVDDARLVVLNAVDAAAKGADIFPRTRVIATKREQEVWRIELQNQAGEVETVYARLVVNAAGPWVDAVLGNAFSLPGVHNVRLVQGSHIVVPRKYEHDRAYIFQNPDERIIFAIPFERDFTLIGTTDQDYMGDPADVRITDPEIDYLCEGASLYFKEPIRREDIVWTFSGVRPLFDDGASKAQEATRDYVLKSDGGAGKAPVINLFGGKITTYRRLAEAVMKQIETHLEKRGAPWTTSAPLPGGNFSLDGFLPIAARLTQQYPFLNNNEAERLIALYGTSAFDWLGDSRSKEDLGRMFGAGLSEREVNYLVENEWAKSADDILWRRSKRGLRMTTEQIAELEKFMAKQPGCTAALPEDIPVLPKYGRA